MTLFTTEARLSIAVWGSVLVATAVLCFGIIETFLYSLALYDGVVYVKSYDPLVYGVVQALLFLVLAYGLHQRHRIIYCLSLVIFFVRTALLSVGLIYAFDFALYYTVYPLLLLFIPFIYAFSCAVSFALASRSVYQAMVNKSYKKFLTVAGVALVIGLALFLAMHSSFCLCMDRPEELLNGTGESAKEQVDPYIKLSFVSLSDMQTLGMTSSVATTTISSTKEITVFTPDDELDARVRIKDIATSALCDSAGYLVTDLAISPDEKKLRVSHYSGSNAYVTKIDTQTCRELEI